MGGQDTEVPGPRETTSASIRTLQRRSAALVRVAGAVGVGVVVGRAVP